MSQPRPLVDRSIVVRLLKLQLVLTLGVTLAGMLAGLWAGFSAGMGGVIALAGSGYFALQAFRHAGATSASHIVRSFFKGEAGRFVLTAALFAVVFATVKSVQAVWLLTGFILVHLVGAWGILLAGTTGTKK
ncbi:MAG TPA: ATP synthase subunit I [Moraxellaceae bacterium]|nr:ATP synthase subunit I [Moraxellaceae bacterium]HQX90382.1 ATP synthase subunit I [Moraxellaceae bacterium]